MYLSDTATCPGVFASLTRACHDIGFKLLISVSPALGALQGFTQILHSVEFMVYANAVQAPFMTQRYLDRGFGAILGSKGK